MPSCSKTNWRGPGCRVVAHCLFQNLTSADTCGYQCPTSDLELMKLKLACADFAFPLLPHDRVLDLIAMLEFEGVDIGLFEGRSHLWPSKVFTRPAKSGQALRRQLADRGLRCADVFLQMASSFVP